MELLVQPVARKQQQLHMTECNRTQQQQEQQQAAMRVTSRHTEMTLQLKHLPLLLLHLQW
jgi:hypothetical protein